MKLQLTSLASLLAVACISSAAMADSYSTSFEDFDLGSIAPAGVGQNGWSGGAQPGLTNNDAGDEQIVNTEAHTGVQSWHYARGYDSPGQGTAYTPNLVNSVSNIGDVMTGSLWFKAHTPGDLSALAIETGNLAGDDRAEILAYVDNLPTGLVVRSFEYLPAVSLPVPVPASTTHIAIAADLDASLWHELSFSLTRTATGNDLSISVDGGTAVNFEGYLSDWRTANAYGYSESSRLKLRPRHADGNSAFNGFYLDDISYNVVVPEPASLAAIAGVGLLTLRRRRMA